ncbi:hypothetical protein [Xanthomonas arboricola]|nr:hypothetical protein [Xanthomonas arboricola]
MSEHEAGMQEVTAIDQGLFRGVAVVIDDGVGRGETDILEIVAAIKDGGGHPIILDKLPNKDTDLENFANVAFFVMDWNLLGIGADEGVAVPATLREHMVTANLEFLCRLSKNRHAPVFIFTNENPAEVIEALTAYDGLGYVPSESHIIVKRKADVRGDVYRVLNEWADSVPSAFVLKKWERSLIAALNAMFYDFHTKSRHWPVMFWEASKIDGVPPSEELARLITRLVTSRMITPEFNLDGFDGAMKEDACENPEAYRKSLMHVLEAERIVLNERLDGGSVTTGDFFEEINDGVKKYLLNIRAECDCARSSNPELHLLKGKIINAAGVIDKRLGNALEKDNQSIVFAMFEGHTVAFNFTEFKVAKWNSMKDKRKGRLLAPFITRILQRYAAYSQRPGLPRLPPALLDQIKPTEQGDAQDGVTDPV